MFIHDHVADFPVQVMCEVLGVSRGGYYAWASRAESPRATDDRALAAEIRAAHEASRGRYGSPRVHAELRTRGRRIGRKRVARLMRRMGLAARRRRRFRRTTDSRHGLPIAPNRLERNFTAEAPVARRSGWEGGDNLDESWCRGVEDDCRVDCRAQASAGRLIAAARQLSAVFGVARVGGRPGPRLRSRATRRR